LKDLFTTLIDAKWRFTFAIFSFNLVTSWTIFASLWYLQAFLYGDIEHYEKVNSSQEPDKFIADNPHTPCVREVFSFATAFLFSLETQHTIGYGFRHPTDQCALTPILIIVQSICGMMLAAVS
jgi:potassium inwardly-rectifying channel subfamily J